MTVELPEGWAEEDIVMVSSLEHYSYCPRQCALIHLEQTFDENLYTLRGRRVHEKAHEGAAETISGVRVERGLPIWSRRLGLVGRADVVEFHGDMPYPVEYKAGPLRNWRHAAVQLCAQALCLEEMTGAQIVRGAVYHYASRRRREVVFDQGLRLRAEETVSAVRRMLRKEHLPPAVYDKRCGKCSLADSCLPSVSGGKVRLHTWREGLFRAKEDIVEDGA